jgi:hypothetical protein
MKAPERDTALLGVEDRADNLIGNEEIRVPERLLAFGPTQAKADIPPIRTAGGEGAALMSPGDRRWVDRLSSASGEAEQEQGQWEQQQPGCAAGVAEGTRRALQRFPRQASLPVHRCARA